jgi:hypothetical protein
MLRSSVIVGVALLSGLAVAKGKPEPAPCPPDVAAALAEACPCDGGTAPWKNHGRYVSCVVRFRNQLRKGGCLTPEAKRETARCAARSTCGRPDMVLCCRYTPGVCSDPTPGDTIAAGTCSNDATAACDTDADCTQATGPVLARDAAACSARSGTAVGSGSVCSTCPIPAPAP